MNAIPPAMPPSIAEFDSAGRLLSAGDRLDQLNRAAGGDVGMPFAVPPIAAIVGLAGRLGIPIARVVTVGDGEGDAELMVRADAVAGGVRLSVSGWRALHADDPDEPPAADFLKAEADWLWEADAALRLRFLSPIAGKRHGIDVDAAIGQPVTRLFRLVENEGGELPMLAALAAQGGFTNQRATLREGGAELLLSASPLTDAGGRFAGFIGSARIVASPAEPEPSAPPREFAGALGDRLERALRVPLGRIIAHADSIAAQSEGPLRADYAEYAGDIGSAARHLMGLVDDLADLQSVEDPQLRLEIEPIDLADVARRAAGLVAVRASEGKVRIDQTELADPHPAQGDFRRALQVLVNLIGNAVRYSPSGGMVWIRLEREGDTVCVIVADQGRGIAPENHERIFEKFERIGATEAGGSGLGLYISRRLARSMCGDISVDSAPGQGARFVFTLPAAG